MLVVCPAAVGSWVAGGRVRASLVAANWAPANSVAANRVAAPRHCRDALACRPGRWSGRASAVRRSHSLSRADSPDRIDPVAVALVEPVRAVVVRAVVVRAVEQAAEIVR